MSEHVAGAARGERQPGALDDSVESLVGASRETRGADRDAVDTVDTLLLALAEAPDVAPGPGLAPDDIVDDDFRIVRELGAGGMGVVYLARDQRLDRDVALKLCGRLASHDAEDRLVREAVAMAQLSHPNVVAVHEVGTTNGRVFLAMEYVAGGTVRDWLARKERSWRDIARVFAAAGRGLAAAHDAGLIHRDLKPDNILIGPDGRVRVADFGLARAPVAATADGDESGSRPGDVEQLLTSPGAVVGTPAYMAPEQRSGREIDARADQYAFCVTLHEALHGARPETEVSTGRTVPRHLRRAIARGLSRDPSDRHPSMHALVAALERDPAARRKTWLLVALAGAGIATGIVGVSTQRAGAPPCPSAAPELAAVWNDARASEAEQAFAAAGVSHGADTWSRVRATLDRYAEGWVAASARACRDTRVHGVQSDELLDRRTACLSRQQSELDALVSVLVAADGAVVHNAARAAQSLPDPRQCDDRVALLAQVAAPAPAIAADVEAVRREDVDRAKALFVAGKWREAAPVASAALARAEELDYKPLIAEVLIMMAEIQLFSAARDAAEANFERAYFTARGAGHDLMVLRAAIGLVSVIGVQKTEFDRADEWARHALAEVERQGEGSLEHARLLRQLGALAETRGDYPRAMELLEGSLELFGKHHGDVHRSTAAALSSLAIALGSQGRLTESIAHHRRVVAIYEELIGPEHPDVGWALSNLAVDLTEIGHSEEAETLLRRALKIREEVQGPDTLTIGYTLLNLAIAVDDNGDHAGALALHERALAIVERDLGADHADVALCLNSMGEAHKALGQLERARASTARAVAIFEAEYGERHVLYAVSLSNLASIIDAQGDHKGARTRYREAIAILEDVAPRHGDLGFAMARLGYSLLATGQNGEAESMLERALALYDQLDAPSRQVEEARAWLSQARDESR